VLLCAHACVCVCVLQHRYGPPRELLRRRGSRLSGFGLRELPTAPLAANAAFNGGRDGSGSDAGMTYGVHKDSEGEGVVRTTSESNDNVGVLVPKLNRKAVDAAVEDAAREDATPN
jgi:hypothetical protein